MSPPAPPASTGAYAEQAARGNRPTLRLVAEEPQEKYGHQKYGHREGHADIHRDSPRILIVAAGARTRALVHREMAAALAPETVFAQAANVWEVLAQAPLSGVVMLAEDLPDVSARTLMELLGRRHPWLPIVVLEAPDAEAQAGVAPA
jgi:hypothetical protein